MATAPWRVVIVTSIPAVAHGYAAITRACGHEPVAVIVPRRAVAPVADFPDDLDVLFARTKRSLEPMLRAYEPDLALCTGFPWLIPAEAIAVPRLGIVNGHPSLLPRYRGPHPLAWAVRNGEGEIGMSYHLMDAEFDTGNVLAQQAFPLDPEETMESLIPKLEGASIELLPKVFARLAAGERGEAQEGGDYQHPFEPEYAVLDLGRPAADVHRQVRAWSFAPAPAGPTLDGRRIVRTSLTEVDGAERLECSDGPLWVVESETAG
jgi:methionyl-tRNA formyltransferase